MSRAKQLLRRFLQQLLVATLSVALALLTFVASVDTVVRSDWAGRGLRACAAPAPDCGYCEVCSWDDDWGCTWGVGNSLQPGGYGSQTSCYEACAAAFAASAMPTGGFTSSMSGTATAGVAGDSKEWDIAKTVQDVGLVIDISSGMGIVFSIIFSVISGVICTLFNVVNGIIDLFNAIPFVPDLPNLTDVFNFITNPFGLTGWGLGDTIESMCSVGGGGGGAPGTDGNPPIPTTYCADGYGSQITDLATAQQCCTGAPAYNTTPAPPLGTCPLGAPGQTDLPDIAATIADNVTQIDTLTDNAVALEGPEDTEVAAGEGVPEALPGASEARDAGFASTQTKPGAAADGEGAGVLGPQAGKRKPPGPGSGFGDFLGSLFGTDNTPGTGAPTGVGDGTGRRTGSAEDSTYQTGGAAALRARGGPEEAGLPGGGSTVETWGPSGVSEIEGAAHPMGSEDPDDYFGLAGDENIFKRVERRYKKKSGDWHQEDRDAERDRAREKAKRKLK